MQSAKIGDLASAELQLELFLIQKQTPRVYLELARVEFLQGKLAEAEEHFKIVTSIPDVPLTVLDKVDNFLSRIANARGYIDYSANFVTDDNPMNFTDASRVKVGNLYFTLRPPAGNKRVYGLDHNVSFSSPHNRAMYFSGSLSIADFEARTVDRSSGIIGVYFPTKLPYLETLSFSLEGFSRESGLLYRQPAVSFISRPVFRYRDVRVRVSYKLGELDVLANDYNDADVHQITYTVDGLRTRFGHLSSAISYKRSEAQELAYSHSGPSINTTFSGYAFNRSYKYKASLSWSKSDYKAPDPLFGQIRHSDRFGASFTVYPSWARALGRRGGFALQYDENKSSLDYYTFEKTSFSLIVK